MGKLPNRKYDFKADNGDVFTFHSEVTVTPDGIFHLSVPTELDEVGRLLAKRETQYPYITIGYRHGSTKLWVSGRSLHDCEVFIKDISTEYLKCEVTTEKIIAYGFEMNLAAWRGMDGGYYPNGSFGREGLWLGTRFDNFILETHRPTDYYKLGIAAYIADKTTYTRASGAKVVYKRVSVHNMDDDSYLRKLNSFCGLSPHAPGQSGMQEMPYSEQAAKFFYDVMIGLCALADKVATFLDNKEILAIAIEKQALLLPDHKEI